MYAKLEKFPVTSDFITLETLLGTFPEIYQKVLDSIKNLIIVDHYPFVDFKTFRFAWYELYH